MADQRHPKRWWILAVICISVLTAVLDNTVLNVAIPSMSSELGATTTQLQWILNAYSLVQAGLLVAAGGLGDRYGRKRALAGGLALFGAGSLGAALSGTATQLIASRAVMGVGAAFLMASSLAVLVRVFDDAERPKAFGAWAATAALGIAIGPLVGGFLLANFWWGSVFLVNVPIALLGAIAVSVLVPETRDPEGERPDLLGGLLSIVATVGLLYAVTAIPEYGWTSAQVLLSALVGAAAAVGFAVWSRKAAYPMLDVALFRDPRFSGAVAGGVLAALGMGGALFLLTQHLQLVLGYSALEAGLRVAPMAVSVFVCSSVVSPKVIAGLGAPRTAAAGLAVSGVGLAVLAWVAADGIGYAGMLLALVLIGAGLGIAIPVTANALMGAIPPERAGTGSGVNSALQELGTGLGVAVLGAILMGRFVSLVPSSVSAAADRSLPAALDAAHRRGDGGVLAQVQHAFTSGMSLSLLVAAAALLVGGALAGLLIGRQPGTAGAPGTAEAPGAATLGGPAQDAPASAV
ncbi:MFS transporter [Streptomyces sp. NPDC039016]|uniref:MFS transporter n=1 Tax=unclassified Streptomyces TaxID=2593676 RepID=UPI002152D2B0|nr:MFS transporter [Streptomyces sp. CB02959]